MNRLLVAGALLASLAVVDASPASAQERTSCAETFSARLAAARAAQEAFTRSHPPNTPYEVQPTPEDVACEAEDVLHRIGLVPHVGDRLWNLVLSLEILCYGNTREGCTHSRETIAQARARMRERAPAGPRP